LSSEFPNTGSDLFLSKTFDRVQTMCAAVEFEVVDFWFIGRLPQ
jgi:hypothetical protein